jgi:hypothetical protein
MIHGEIYFYSPHIFKGDTIPQTIGIGSISPLFETKAGAELATVSHSGNIHSGDRKGGAMNAFQRLLRIFEELSQFDDHLVEDIQDFEELVLESWVEDEIKEPEANWLLRLTKS